MFKNSSSDILTFPTSKNLKEMLGAYSDSGRLVYAFDLIANQDNHLFLSSLIITVQDGDDPDAGLGYHTLLLGDTAKELPPPVDMHWASVGNFKSTVCIGDAADAVYHKHVREFLALKFPRMKPENMQFGGFSVLPVGYNYEDMQLLHSTLVNATNAASHWLSFANTPETLELPRGHKLKFELRENSKNVYASFDAVGEPVRADVVLDCYLESSAKLTTLNAPPARFTLCKLNGFYDVGLTGSLPQDAVQNFVITDCRDLVGHSVQAFLLYLVAAATQRTMTKMGLNPVLRSQVSLDVAEHGPDTWFTDVYAAGAYGSAMASGAILEAMQKFTGRKFDAKIVNSNDLFQGVHRIPTGWIIDEDARRTDVRVVDHAYLAKVDAKLHAKWAKSFRMFDDELTQSTMPALQVAQRLEVLQELLGDRFVHTGYSRRVTFADSFLDTLVEYAAYAGIHFSGHSVKS